MVALASVFSIISLLALTLAQQQNETNDASEILIPNVINRLTASITSRSTPLFTPLNPLSMLLALPVARQSPAPVGIMNIIAGKSSFRSGGNEFQVVLLNPGGQSALYNTSYVSLHYFEANNSSPNKANTVVSSQCRVSCCSFLFCPFPDISQIFPNFTADVANSSIQVEPIGDFGGCKYVLNRRRLCYTLTGDNQPIGFTGSSSASSLPPQAVDILRVSQTLGYFPDPIILNISLAVNSKRRIKFTGLGLNGENSAFTRAFNMSLARGKIKCALTAAQTTDPLPLDSSNSSSTASNVTSEPPVNTNTQLFCDFDNARLVDALEEMYGHDYLTNSQQVVVDVFIRNGKWQYNGTLAYALDNLQIMPVTPYTLPYTGPPVTVIVAIVVPLCFISVVIAGACVALCTIRYGYSPCMIKASERIAKACPGLAMCVKPPVKPDYRKNLNDIEQLLRLLPEDLNPIVINHIIDSDRVEAGQEIGNGNFGIVRCGNLMHGKQVSNTKGNTADSVNGGKELVALKFIQKYSDVEQLREFFEEAILTFSFDCPNVLSAYGITTVDEFPAVVLPLMDAGDLRKFVQTAANQVTDLLVLDFAIQIARGMQYLAENDIIHRDLAARNCLLNKHRVVKVADFGLSRKAEGVDEIYELPNYIIKTHKRPLPIRWMAPESLETGIFSEKTDVWAYGVVLWELTTRGARPYPAIDSNDLKRHVCIEKQRLPKLPMISDILYEVMASCWNEHSSARLTFAELVIYAESLLNDPDSAFWNGEENNQGYRNPEDTVMKNFEDSLQAFSVYSSTSGVPSEPDTSDRPEDDDDEEDQYERQNGLSPPGEHPYVQSYNRIDSGVVSATSPNFESGLPPLSEYTGISRPNAIKLDPLDLSKDVGSREGRERCMSLGNRHTGDGDSVFMVSRPETPTPPDSAISGMSGTSFSSSPRHAWSSRSFSVAHPVKSSPSIDSAASTTSSGRSFGSLANSIRRTKPPKLLNTAETPSNTPHGINESTTPNPMPPITNNDTTIDYNDVNAQRDNNIINNNNLSVVTVR